MVLPKKVSETRKIKHAKNCHFAKNDEHTDIQNGFTESSEKNVSNFKEIMEKLTNFKKNFV